MKRFFSRVTATIIMVTLCMVSFSACKSSKTNNASSENSSNRETTSGTIVTVPDESSNNVETDESMSSDIMDTSSGGTQNNTGLTNSKTDVATHSQSSNSSENSTVVKNYGEAKVHFIDVTDPASYIAGDSILIQVAGKNVLIDGGEDRAIITDRVISYLKSQGVRKLDYVFLSHAHSDHAGGLAKIINAFELGSAASRKPDFSLLASCEAGWKTEYYYNSFVDAVKKKGKTVTQITKEGTRIKLGADSYITIYGSSLVDNQTKDEDYNFLSLTFLFVHGNKKMYLSGDAGDPTDSVVLGKLGQCDVIKPGHHGSGGPYSSVALLNELQPQYAVFTTFIMSSHDYNDYYYQTVQRVSAIGGRSYSSAANGTIVVTTDGNSITSFSGINILKP